MGYGRHLLASAPAPATTKATTVGYGRHLLAQYAPAPGPGLTKSEFLPFGRRLLASAPAPASELPNLLVVTVTVSPGSCLQICPCNGVLQKLPADLHAGKWALTCAPDAVLQPPSPSLWAMAATFWRLHPHLQPPSPSLWAMAAKYIFLISSVQ